jgi:hypothetical protein
MRRASHAFGRLQYARLYSAQEGISVNTFEIVDESRPSEPPEATCHGEETALLEVPREGFAIRHKRSGQIRYRAHGKAWLAVFEAVSA